MTVFKHAALIKSWFYEQVLLQEGQAILWLPVFLALGIGAYFSWPVEPPAVMGAGALLVSGFALWFVRGRRYVCFVLFLVVLGFGAAQLRTMMAYTPMLSQNLRTSEVTGRIAEIEYLESEGRSVRFLLDDVAIERLQPDDTPVRVRLTLRVGAEADMPDYRVRAVIRGLGKLNAPSGPSVPGGFDFRRYLFYQQIGGLGFFFRPPEVLEQGRGAFMEGVRQSVAQHVLAAMGPRTGPVAVALLTGQRAGIDKADAQAMRDAGLAHLLAISGLHIGLFSGFVFFILRGAMALIPWMALHVPIKKVAAVAAFGAAVFYMVLAGATIPTQRAVLMAGVVFLAIVLDRSAVSMRLVAFAAFIVLLLMPESLLSASFQLSFAAVAGLVWIYDLMRGWWGDQARERGVLRRFALYLFGVSMTTVVARVLTGPLALYHFQQIGVLSVLANMLAVPVTSFVIMPMAVVSLAAMIVGLEAVPLWIVEQGVDVVLHIARDVAGMEHSVMRVASWPGGAIIAIVIGSLIVMLVRGPLRYIGLVGFVVAAMFVRAAERPDILIAGSQDAWAYYDGGVLHVSARNKERFLRENWERHYGLKARSAERWAREESESLRCDELACRLDLRGYRVSFVRDIQAVESECAWADVLVSKRSVWGDDCAAAYLVDYQAGKYGGVHGIYLDADSVRVEAADDSHYRRAWHQAESRLAD